MTQTAHIDLSEGKKLNYEIRFSAKAKNLRLKMTARAGLAVIAPKSLRLEQIINLVNKKRDWITKHLEQFDDVRQLLGEKELAKPDTIDLTALNESWHVEYLQTKSKNVAARTNQQGHIIVYGMVNDDSRNMAALRRWLLRYGKAKLAPWLVSLAAELGLKFKRFTIKNQRTRWGSCSANNVISLNAKLLFLPPELVRYVLVHELCHILERNHTSRFWTHVRQLEPKTDQLHAEMRDAWKMIPAWAHPIKTTQERF